ncbi:MAG: hypothetical protein AAGF27_09395 [Pseudomonadota bacterium]
MTIKSRVQKLEQRNVKLAVLTFGAFCADTGDGLPEVSRRARYFAGSLSTEFVRAPRENLDDFKNRVLTEGTKTECEVHPNAIFVYAGLMGAEHQHCR